MRMNTKYNLAQAIGWLCLSAYVTFVLMRA